MKSLLVELPSIHEPQILFALLKSSGKDLGEGMMAGGAGGSVCEPHMEAKQEQMRHFQSN